MATGTARQFHVLHGLRGVASLAVVIRHASYETGYQLTPSSHLAVDLFFVLSGFVIAHAYEDRLRGGMSFGAFVKTRLIRLYPLYGLALAVRAAFMATQWLLGMPDAPSASVGAARIGFGALILPTPPLGEPLSTFLFPTNGPAWSLFFELVANFAYAALATRLNRPWLIALILANFAALLVLAFLHHHMIDGGFSWRNAVLGLPRVGFGFLIGVYLRRYHFDAPIADRRIGLLVFGLLSIVLTAIFVYYPNTPRRTLAFEIASVALVFPIIVYLAARLELGATWERIAHQMGELSYPAYVLHVPILAWAIFALTNGWNLPHGHLPGMFVLGFALLIGLTSLLLAKVYDIPVRNWLRRKLQSQRAQEDVTQF